MFNSFPKELHQCVYNVLTRISKNAKQDISIDKWDNKFTYNLLDGQTICIPYRINCPDNFELFEQELSFNEKMIYHCIMSRHLDSFVREKYIKCILNSAYPDWTIPYILKVVDEYVYEILDAIYSALKDKDNEKIKELCQLNIDLFLKSHHRMISYWNEFYRNDYCIYKNYIGNKLFSECFGYTKSMEKERLKLT